MINIKRQSPKLVVSARNKPSNYQLLKAAPLRASVSGIFQLPIGTDIAKTKIF